MPKTAKKIIIAPSILSADFFDLQKDIRMLEEHNITWLHFDVMDGHFVPNISFGVPVFKSIVGRYKLFNDVHIMVSDPLKWGPVFAAAGADLVTFHVEALKSDKAVRKVIKAIREKSAKVGISIKPHTAVETIFPYLAELDLVLVMSVEPGFGGQEFMDNSLDKVRKLRQEISQNNYQTLIEIDGGINEITAPLCRQAGVDVLVAGSYLFGHKDFVKRLKSLHE